MVKVKAQFKRRSTANNVEIYVPVPDDADTPKFRVRFYRRMPSGFFDMLARRRQQVAYLMCQTSPPLYGRSSSSMVAASSSCAHTLVFPVSEEVCSLSRLRCPIFHLTCLLRTEHESLDKRAPITVKFEIPYFTVSGIQVRYLKIVEKSGYQALPWVRYITQNGDDYRCVSHLFAFPPDDR